MKTDENEYCTSMDGWNLSENLTLRPTWWLPWMPELFHYSNMFGLDFL